MSQNTKIEWCDHTFNPWIGCTKVGPGCDNCYAKADFDDRKHRVTWGVGQARSRTKTWGDPVRWNKQADAFFAEHGRRQRVFCASLADVFDNEVDPQWRRELFDLICDTPFLDWLLLTKRIGNAGVMLPWMLDGKQRGLPYPNVWLGATIVNQEEADRDIPKLLAVPAAQRFLSMEPLLGPVDLPGMVFYGTERTGGVVPLRDKGYPQIDWVIVGGESGPNARPMHPDWVRSLRDQCQATGVPFLFKQWGEYWPSVLDVKPGEEEPWRITTNGGRAWGLLESLKPAESWPAVIMARVGKKSAGRLLDGREWNGVPA